MSIRKEKEYWTSRFYKENCIEYKVSGELALFADPITSAGGEKTTYSVPTYEALKGITKSIYWKPTFIWVIDSVRVMNPVMTESWGTRLININKRPGASKEADIANYTYLVNVLYQVKAHIEWNKNRPEYIKDRNYKKHYGEFAKALLKGGRLPDFLGKSECCAYVSVCEFGAGEGYYDHSGEISFGYMYHGITYPDEAYSEETKERLTLNLAPVIMKNGIIQFCRPSECMHQTIRTGTVKQFKEKEE